MLNSSNPDVSETNTVLYLSRQSPSRQYFATENEERVKPAIDLIFSPVASFDARFASPKQSRKADFKRQQYGLFMDTSRKLIQTIENSPERFRTFLATMNREIALAEEQHRLRSLRTATPTPSLNAIPAERTTPSVDPISIPLNGRKRNSRIVSSTEVRDSKGRPKKKVRMEKRGINNWRSN